MIFSSMLICSVANTTVLQTAEPENIQMILALKFQDYDLGSLRKEAFKAVIGAGIFTADGEEWAHYRHQLRPQFNREQVSDLEASARHVQVLFKALPEENSEGWIEGTDLMPYIYRFTMDVSTEFLFGHSVDTQSRALHSQDSGNTADIQEDLEFTKAVNFAEEYTGWRFRFGQFYWLVNSKKFQSACDIVRRLQTGL